MDQKTKKLEVYERIVFSFGNRLQAKCCAYRFDIVMASEEGVPLTKGRSIRHKNFAILIKQEVWVFSGAEISCSDVLPDVDANQ